MDSATPLAPARSAHPRRTRVATLLVLILLLAAALRWHGLTSRGFFFDELWHVEVSNGHGSMFFELPFDRVVDTVNPLVPENALPLWQIPSHTTGVTHPPGAFVSLRLWRDVFGDSMLALRSWSAAWSLLAVGLTFVAGAQSFGAAAGLWAAAFAAVSLGSIDQAQDVRGYSMLQALLLFSAIALLRMRGRGSDWPAALSLAVGVWLVMFTHYFAVGACAAIALGAVTLLRGRVRWQAIGAIVLAGVVWAICWLPSMRSQFAFVSGTVDVFLIDDSPTPIRSTLARAIMSPYRALVADTRAASLLALAGGSVIWLLMAGRLVVRRPKGDRATVGLWLGIVVGSIGVLTAIDLVRHTHHLSVPRYLVLSNPAICILLGSLTAGRWWLRPTIALALFAAYCLTPEASKPDLRPQLAFLRERASPGDLILLPARPDRRQDGQSRYLSLAYGLRWPRLPIAIPVGPQSREWIDSLPRTNRWFCLVFADYDPPTWQPGLSLVATGPSSSGVAVFEVRRSDNAPR